MHARAGRDFPQSLHTGPNNVAARPSTETTVSGIINQKAVLGQENGPDVELMVSGTAVYATYETLDGFPAVYDNDHGLFCYARVTDGRYVSTGVPVSSAPPPGVERHLQESDAVRQSRIVEREREMERRARGTSERQKGSDR